MTATLKQGMVTLTAQSQPAGSGCEGERLAQDYDEQGQT